jgi:hypothetical protein
VSNWRRLAVWFILAIAVCTLWLIYPIPYFLFKPERPVYLWFLSVLAFACAIPMGFFKRGARDFLMAVIGISLLLPIAAPFLMVTVGCFVTVMLGLRGYCL